MSRFRLVWLIMWLDHLKTRQKSVWKVKCSDFRFLLFRWLLYLLECIFCRYLYSGKLPDHLTCKSEWTDLTKLSDRYNVKSVKEFVRQFDAKQFEDVDDDVADLSSNGGFVDTPNQQTSQEELKRYSQCSNNNYFCQLNTVGAQTPNMFGFWMVEHVWFMVPTIWNQNKKWWLAQTILCTNKFCYKTV